MCIWPIPERELHKIVDIALDEDLARGDITSQVLIPDDVKGKASILIKEDGVLAGREVSLMVFHTVDPEIRVEMRVADGTAVKSGDIVGWVSGKVTSVLKAERVALNFMQRLSGIASLTARYVAEVSGTKAGIYDTRKTTPGLRLLEKYAVRMGGGHNHRIDLGDFVLVKDNHIAICRGRGLTLSDIVKQCRAKVPEGMKIEIEVTSVEDALEVANAGADIVMFDNMSAEEMKRGVKMLPAGVMTEASGGINLGTVRQAALTGVDIISVGALTHSPKVLDISLELEL